MIKTISQYIDHTTKYPDQFPMGRLGIATACMFGISGLPLLAAEGILATAEFARNFFGETAGFIAIGTLAGGLCISTFLIREELDKNH